MVQTKRNRAIAMLLFLVMVTSIFASDTLARFTTSVTSSDSSRIAYWGINEGPVTMDLFDGEYFYNDDENGIVLARSHDGDNIIAPGFGKQSEFGILVHESTIAPEVAYELKITLDDSEIDELIKDNTSIQWRLNDGAWGTFDQLKSSLLALSGDPSGYKIYQPGELIQNFRQGEVNTIAWQWIDDPANDAADTELTDYVDFDKANVKLEVTISAVQYLGTSSMLNATSTFNINDNNAVLSFRSAAPVNELEQVKVDGNVVDPSNYEVIEGSTIIKFTDEYARSLSMGNHIIEIVSQNMTAKTNFKIVEEYVPISHNDTIPEGGTYYVNVPANELVEKDGYQFYRYVIGDYEGAEAVYSAGDKFPSPQTGDVYVYGDYEYRYNMEYYVYVENMMNNWNVNNSQNGWGVRVLDSSKSEYGNILSTIASKNIVSVASTFGYTNVVKSPVIPKTVTNMYGTFYFCSDLVYAPEIPYGVTNMDYTFLMCTSLIDGPAIPETVTSMFQAFCSCTSLINAPAIPGSVANLGLTFAGCTSLKVAPVLLDGIIDLTSTFHGCTSLVEIPRIPNTVVSMESTFIDCTSLVNVPVIPNGVINMENTFYGCTSLVNAPVIPSSVINMWSTFEGCTNLTGTIEINGNLTYYDGVLRNTQISWITGSISDELKQKIAKNSGITLEKPIKIYDGGDSSKTGIYYILGQDDTVPGEYFDIKEKYINGAIPEELVDGLVYVYGDYEYRYNMHHNLGYWELAESQNGWGVKVLDTTKTSYGEILSNIAGKDVVDMYGTFYGCSNMVSSPAIPNTVVNMASTFYGCYNLVTAPVIPSSVKNLYTTFASCSKLTGIIEINADPDDAFLMFVDTVKPITLTGSSTKLNEMAATAATWNPMTNGFDPNDNVTVATNN